MGSSDKSFRYAVLALWLGWAWLVMTLSHELGHVAAGLIGGGRLQHLELRPWRLPHSMFVGDRHPLITLWAGPLLGSAVPMLVASRMRRPATTFIAWFCVTANAAYLLLGCLSGDAELDSGRMIALGLAPAAVFGPAALALPIGYWGFRRSCLKLLSGGADVGSRRGLALGVIALAAAVILQAVVGSLVAARL